MSAATMGPHPTQRPSAEGMGRARLLGACGSRPGVPGLVALFLACGIRRAIRRACVADKRAHIDSLAGDMDAAARHGHWRQVWRVGRAIARTGLGPKRRVYRPPDAEPISAEDWDAYMQQAFRAEPVSVRLPLPHYVASRHSARMEMPPLRNFRRNILGAGNNRSVPEGSKFYAVGSMEAHIWIFAAAR